MKPNARSSKIINKVYKLLSRLINFLSRQKREETVINVRGNLDF